MADSTYDGVSALAIDPGQLAERSLSGDRERQLRALVREHFDFIWRLLRRMGLEPQDADDAAQQVFMAATQKSERINSGSERTYLYGIALRVAANARRKLARRRQEAAPLDHEIVDVAAQPEQSAKLGEACSLLDELLATLPEELRRVLVLAQNRTIRGRRDRRGGGHSSWYGGFAATSGASAVSRTARARARAQPVSGRSAMNQREPLDSFEEALFRAARREKPQRAALERTLSAVVAVQQRRRFLRGAFTLGGAFALAASAALVLRSGPGAESIQAEHVAPKPSVASAAATVSAPEPAKLVATTLEEERSMLERVRAELALGNATAALSRLDQYDRVSGGHLTGEATLLRLEALSNSGHAALAQKLARRFVDSDPNGPLAERARAYLPKSSSTDAEQP
ncbi:MAG: RNA polymerase sigma factor [Polyangiaceae bacterium]